LDVYHYQKKPKLPTRQIPPKHLKLVGKLVVGKFTNRFFESVGNYRRINSSVNLSIN